MTAWPGEPESDGGAQQAGAHKKTNRERSREEARDRDRDRDRGRERQLPFATE